jgi:hypothetical protein
MAILSTILPANKSMCCGTTPTHFLRLRLLIFFRSIPPIEIEPLFKGYKDFIHF